MDLADGLFRPPPGVHVRGSGALESVYDVSGLAVAAMAEAAVAVAALSVHHGGAPPGIVVDRPLASGWFGLSFRPVGWSLPPIWDAVAGDYACQDGWLRLHTNVPGHRAAALRVLGCAAERDTVARHVARWDGEDLESAVVAAGGAAALMRSPTQWQEHPQGRAVAAEPLVLWGTARDAPEPVPAGRNRAARAGPDRPLAGVRVLDLTRVIAGPVATRFLAYYGAEVLRLDPPSWEEPALEAEMSVGKYCARLDLKTADGLATLHTLLAGADILIHGYRRDALDALGLSDAQLAERYPALVNIALNAYGWSGPWTTRRGFDSLVQMSCGIAWEGGAGGPAPLPLPVQALDHATGYLCAAAAITAWQGRLGGTVRTARLSLARTGQELMRSRQRGPTAPFTAPDKLPWVPEDTRWGPGLRLPSAVRISGVRAGSDLPARGFGWTAPAWP